MEKTIFLLILVSATESLRAKSIGDSFLGKRKSITRETCIAGYKTDLYIEDTNTIIEIKSILSEEREAMFPAMHSERALIQLNKLSMLLEKGYSVCYIFVSVNPKTKQLILDEADVEYCRLFRTCLMKGMYCCGFSVVLQDGKAKVSSRLKVKLGDE